jgi:hypothetical protein
MKWLFCCIVVLFLSCSISVDNSVNVKTIGIEVQNNRSLIDDSNIKTVIINVTNSLGNIVGSGILDRGIDCFEGDIRINETGLLTFDAKAVDSNEKILYIGNVVQVVSEYNDEVIIPMIRLSVHVKAYNER